MWAVTNQWAAALQGDHTPLARIAFTYDGRETWSSDDQVCDAEVVSQVIGDTQQVETSATIAVADPTGELYTGRADAPIGWMGHRCVIDAGAQVGSWAELVPVGRLRVDAVAVDAGSTPWRLLPSGAWARGAQQLRIRCSDLLSQVGDERLPSPTAPQPGATVRSEIERLVRGIVPVGAWDAPQVVAPSLSYDATDRGEIVASLARSAGLLPCMSRSGVLDMIPSEGTGHVWRVPVDAVITLDPSGSRDRVVNGWVVTSDSQGQPLRGSAVDDSGPLRWGGPFGRVPSYAHSPILTTNTACRQAAETRRRAATATRRATLTVEAVTDWALDPLDTALVELPDRTISGVVTAIRRRLLSGSMTVTMSVPLEV